MLSSSVSDKSNRKGSTIMTAHLLDGKVVHAGTEAPNKLSSPQSSFTHNEPAIPLTQITQMPVFMSFFSPKTSNYTILLTLY